MSHIRNSFSLLLSLASAVSVMGSGQARADTFYVVRPVGPLPGFTGPTWAVDVNDVGTVYGVGMVNGSRESRCFVLDNGTMTLIASESAQPYIWPGSINNAKDIVGTQFVPGIFNTHYAAFVGVLNMLPDIFPQFPSGQASYGHGINDGVAGGAPWSCGTLRQDAQIGVGGFSVFHGYMTLLDGNPNPAMKLTALGGTFVRAEALNDARDVVGTSLSAMGPLRAFLRTGGTGPTLDLGTLGGTGSHSWATDINNAQQVVGWSRVADGGTRAFVFQNAVMSSLGTLGGNISEARGLNEAGQIVGMSHDAQHKPRAFLFEDSEMIDLNRRIAADSGWTLQVAKAINESGTIVGWGRLQGETRGFRLTPRATGDVTLDGTVDGDDLREVGLSWGECLASSAADVAPPGGDGLVNEQDLLAVISNWTP